VLALPMAEQFFQEFCLFGRMGLTTAKSAVLDSYRKERAPVMLKFLRSLERVRGLRFRSDSHLAFCLLSESGDSATPLFGYTGALGGPLPTEVAHSLLRFWEVQAEVQRAPHPAMAAVLAHLARHGYERAVNYLYDLNESGYLNQESLHLIARCLIQGRALTITDDELVAALTGARCSPNTTDREWMNQPLEVSWLSGQDTSAAAFPELLIDRSWEEVQKLRECSTIDDWAAQLFASMPALTSLGGLIDAGATTAGIAVNAARAQLAEIHADLGGPWMDQKSGIGLLTIVGTVMLAQAAPHEQAGDEWIDRAYAERAAVPRAVFDGLLGQDGSWSRDDWFQLSWRTIVPWTAHFRPGETVMTRRGSYDGFIAEKAYPEKRPKSLTKAMAPVEKLFARQRYAEAIELLRPLEKLFPYASPLYALLAVVLDNFGWHQEALEAMLPALILEPAAPFLWTTSARVAYTNGCEPDAMLLETFGTLLAHESGSGRR
jgi:tetratricopeptide (TPR) repeat protein